MVSCMKSAENFQRFFNLLHRYCSLLYRTLSAGTGMFFVNEKIDFRTSLFSAYIVTLQPLLDNKEEKFEFLAKIRQHSFVEIRFPLP